MFTKQDIVRFCAGDRLFSANNVIDQATYNHKTSKGGCTFHANKNPFEPACVAGYIINGLAPDVFVQMGEADLLSNEHVRAAFEYDAVILLSTMQQWADRGTPWHVAYRLAVKDLTVTTVLFIR